jgi:amino acid transporter
MSLSDILFGRPLATSEERGESLGVSQGIPVFGLDALSSAAYGPEAALTLLIPLGALGVHYIVPISTSIIVLLTVVYFSYRQTIAAYPGGGGSYTVARQNLGASMGLLAAAALLIDYVLVVAVGISAGVGALVSAVPSAQPHTLAICVTMLLFITLVNLRGMRDTGLVFMAPTYLFVGSLLIAVGMGLWKTLGSGGHPVPVVAPPQVGHAALAGATAWLLLQAFASGCTAMTGVEAVSNGVKAFRAPVTETATRTLTVIIGLLIVLLAGIAYLVNVYGIAATDPGVPGYQSVLSLLFAAVTGRGLFYQVSMVSILLVLVLSANTAFADFPRLCRAIAMNGYLPRSFTIRGRRLAFSQGIWVLAVLAGMLLVLFGGVTDRLIPLFAVGAFLAFTLSQSGMVAHWRRVGGPGSSRSMVVNAVGALATGITTLVVLVAKFAEGAWVTAILIPTLVLLMGSVRRHYHKVLVETRCPEPLEAKGLEPPVVVVPVERWTQQAKNALQFALTISKDVQALHIAGDQDRDTLKDGWEALVEDPAKEAGFAPPKLVVLPSPYRLVISPIVDYVLDLETKLPTRTVAILIPELVEHRWYLNLLHNKRASFLKAVLLLKGSRRIAVINLPWYLAA